MATKLTGRTGFHGSRDSKTAKRVWGKFAVASEFSYTFENFFHPFVGELIEKLNKDSLTGLLDPQFHEDLGDTQKTPSSSLPGEDYTPNPDGSDLVNVIFHDKTVDVDLGGPYANYNWELFFHIPLTIAVHLSKNQRFAEAQRWFHFIFDPTANDTSLEVPERFWRFIAFRKGSAGKQVDVLLALLSTPDSDLDGEKQGMKRQILQGYQAIMEKPFQPHAVARTRHFAYMYNVVMKYLDNLIAWGDHLFHQDTRESITEAIQIYVLAANILGNRPERVPLKGRVQPKTFAQLKEQGLDSMGNALVELEGLFPFNLGMPDGSEGKAAAAPLFGIGPTLYFCIPRNDKLLGYWDTVADRLFKIRHCMNIEGVVRPLALFDPPIDPGMLVKASAAGIDIGAIVAGLNQPVSPVRSELLIQKALELCSEVRNLGSALLSAIEKEDGERLTQMRQGHEVKIQQLQQDVRFLQWKQAQEATESLLKTRAVTLERYQYYLHLLGQTPDANLAPDKLPLDRRELTEENFDEAYEALVGQYGKEIYKPKYPKLSLADSSSLPGFLGLSIPGVSSLGRLALSTHEKDEIDRLVDALGDAATGNALHALASAFVSTPDGKINFHYWGVGTTIDTKVGTALVSLSRFSGDVANGFAALRRDQAGIMSRTASYERRFDDWVLQANLAARELQQIGRQVISSLIGEQIAYREYQNVRKQIEHAQEIDRFLHDKFTNAELYAWMQGELSRLYYEYYRFAFDVARRAEQTMKRELMRSELDGKTFVKFNYWDAGRKGLLSGEALYLDLKRMEMAYHEYNLREYELTKHVSLLQLDPLALIQLRTSGRCTVRLPEMLFDMDGPGHYFRRIKSVALSIPCVTGPYVGVNCKLTLLKSSIRTKPALNGGYAREGTDDIRFQDYFGTVQSVVASSGQQDSGLFETSLRDERYLPFENAGVISEWRLELPADPGANGPIQFDYDTISDVILHIRYTAREGGQQLREAAMDQIKSLIQSGGATGSVRLFSIRHEFPSAWVQFKKQPADSNRRHKLELDLREEHYPFWSRGHLKKVQSVKLLARPEEELSGSFNVEAGQAAGQNMQEDGELNGLLKAEWSDGQQVMQTPVGLLNLSFDDNHFSDILLLLGWKG